jgi:hypothetical protein
LPFLAQKEGMDATLFDLLDHRSLSQISGMGARTVLIGATAVVLCFFTASCTEILDAGSSRPHGQLPVDERNPLVVLNDGAFDNWGTEYAVLLAHDGGPELAGIIIGTSGPWPELDVNVAGVRDLVLAARKSGLRNTPDPIASIGDVLKRPTSGEIDETQANRSEGALFIVDASKRLALSYRPLVVAVGGRLTDVADAYLIDHSVTERVVVVASLGSLSASGATMAEPNGEMDPWADTIVSSRFRYVQVSAFYDQLQDIPSSRTEELPDNAFGTWLAAKQSAIWSIPEAADQVAVAAVGIPGFVTEVARTAPAGPVDSGAGEGPALVDAPNGSGWLVRQVAGSAVTERVWSILSNSATFEP